MTYYLQLDHSGRDSLWIPMDKDNLYVRLLKGTNLDSAMQEANALIKTQYSYGYPMPPFIKATMLEVSNSIDIPLKPFEAARGREIEQVHEEMEQREFARLKTKYEVGAK